MLFKCPTIGKIINSGDDTTLLSSDRQSDGRVTLKCPYCGDEHSWVAAPLTESLARH